MEIMVYNSLVDSQMMWGGGMGGMGGMGAQNGVYRAGMQSGGNSGNAVMMRRGPGVRTL